jgi:hypothetical protein
MPGLFRPRTPEPARGQPATGREVLLEGEILARWYIEMRFEEEVERSHRYGRPLSVLVATPSVLPGETPAGKAVHAAAAAARAAARSMDLVGWIDEQTILMLLPETSREEARSAASRWRNEMYARSRNEGGQKWEIRIAHDWMTRPDGQERLRQILDGKVYLEVAA